MGGYRASIAAWPQRRGGAALNARRTLLLGWCVALLAIAGFASLGHWQYGRMQEKQAMLEAVAETLAQRTPAALSRAEDAAAAGGYDWAAGEGRFAEVPALLLDNQMREGQAGVRAYRLFLPQASGAAPLLVELGWLPLGAGRQMPAVERPVGTQHVAGLLVPPPSPGLLRAAPQPQADGSLLLTTLEPALLAEVLRQPALAPRVLKLDPALPLGYSRDLDVLPNTLPPEKHLGYAVQWFALALTVLATALLLTYRSRRRGRSPHA